MRNETQRSRTQRKATLAIAASAAVAAALPFFGRATSARAADLYWDLNQATANTGTSGAGTWNATNSTWNDSSTGTGGTIFTWQDGSIAHFSSGTGYSGTYNVTVSGVQKAGGLVFEEGNVTLVGDPATAGIDFQTNPFTIQTRNGQTQNIQVPIFGSGDMTIAPQASSFADTTINIDGSMNGFTGNIIVGSGTSATALLKVQMDWAPGDPTKTITLNSFSELSNNNQVTLTGGTTTPNAYDIRNPIVLAGTDAWLASANGPAGIEKTVTYSGQIAGTGNLWLGIGNSGGRGDVILGNTGTAQYTYPGNTYLTMANNNGLVQLGNDNILPATTVLTYGPAAGGSSAVAPFDMNGHNLKVAGLQSNTTSTSTPIYNTAIDVDPAPVTLTIDGGANTTTNTFIGVIGQTATNVNPFNDNAPFFNTSTSTTRTHASTGISVIKAGNTTQIFTQTQLYTGNTTINGGTIVLGKTFGTQASPPVLAATHNTISGNVIVNAGGTLQTTGGTVTYWAATGATDSRVTVNGGTLTPGGTGVGGANPTLAATIGGLYANAMTLNANSDEKFDILSRISYDSIKITNDLTLGTGPHTIDVTGVPGSTGFFPIMTFGSLSDPGSTFFTLGSATDPSNTYQYSLAYDNNLNPTQLLLHIQGGPSRLRWDSDGNPNNGATEGSNTWTNGDTHWIDSSDGTQKTYDNSANLDVTIGDDTTQNGGTITLGGPVRVGGKLTFNPLLSTPYTINGAGNTLTTSANGVEANYSANINAAVVLEADQTWNVASGATLTATQNVSGAVTLTKGNPGQLVLAGGLSVNNLTVSAGNVTLSGGTVNVPNVVVNGGSLTSTATAPTIGQVDINNGATAAFNGANGNVSVVNINSGTLSLGDASALGPENAAFVNIGTGSHLAFTAPMDFHNDLAPVTTGSGQNWNFDFGGNNVTFSGLINFTGNASKNGTGEWTISGNNTAWVGGSGVGILICNNATTLHLLSAHALGTQNFSAAGGSVLDAQVDSSLGAIRNDIGLLTKTGPGTLIVSSSTGQTAVGANASFVIAQGAVEMDSNTSLGGSNGTAASPNKQFPITLNAGTELIAHFGNARDSMSMTFNNNTFLTLPSSASNTADTEFTGFSTNGTTFTGFNATATVNGNVTWRNLSQAPSSGSRDLMMSMPVNVTAGSTLTLESENNTGNYEQAGVLLRGVDNVNAYPGFALFMNNGTTEISTGTGDVNMGSTGRGFPIVATGLGAGSGTVLKLGSHTFLRDAGSAADNSTGTASTKLVVLNGATMRFEAPMNANYVDPNDNPIVNGIRSYDGTTGLFGSNTTSTMAGGTLPTGGYTTLANGFTVLSNNRANNLSRVYQPTGSSANTPSGSLVLAATDATDATGVINTGPNATCAVGLVVDNATSSANANLTYRIDGQGDSGKFANYASFTVQKTNAGSGSVKAQLVSTTRVPQVNINNGTQLDIQDQKLILTTQGAGTWTGAAYTGASGLVAAGRNSNLWNGSGIVTSQSAAQGSNFTAIGVAKASDVLPATATATALWAGQTITGTDTLVMYTYGGDATLDGKINVDDYIKIDSGIAAGLTGWVNGDFNYDGKVNIDDYTQFIDANIGTQGAPFPTAGGLGGSTSGGGVSGVSAVPEPATIGLSAIGLAMALLPRRRQRRQG